MFAGETVRCTGKVIAEDGDAVSIECSVEVVGENARIAVAPASAEVLRADGAVTI